MNQDKQSATENNSENISSVIPPKKVLVIDVDKYIKKISKNEHQAWIKTSISKE